MADSFVEGMYIAGRMVFPERSQTLATKSLYVGNLPYRITEDDLRAIFEAYGPVTEARVIENRGFGFVDVPEENMTAAIEATNGTEFEGRTLTVNEARPREERPRDGGGGGGGGRGGFGGGRGGGGRGGGGGGGGRSRGW